MRKLSVEDIVKNNENCYSFVVSVAKRARQITDTANDEGAVLDENPVKTAIKEFVGGRFRIEQKNNEEADAENPQDAGNVEKEELEENTEPADIAEKTDTDSENEKDDGEKE